MNTLKARIMQEGRNLGGGILKVDGLINHQVDPALMDECGRDLAACFAQTGATRILTAEISGIAPALMTARYLKIPGGVCAQNPPHHHAGHGLPHHCTLPHQGQECGIDRIS